MSEQPRPTQLEYSSAQACARLGVSPSTLRRRAATFEAIFEPLERDNAGTRRYTDAVLAQLERAEALREGGAASLEAALKMLAGGDDRLSAQASAQVSAQGEMSEALLAELRTLSGALRDVSAQLRVYNERPSRSARLRSALENALRWWRLLKAKVRRGA